jgi:hypothetical protein
MSEFVQDKKSITLLSLYLFVLSATLYIFTASPNYYSNDSAMLRAEVVQSLVERRDISISSEVGIIGRDGRAYSWLGIGSALLSVPFYIFGKAVSISPKNIIMFINQLFGAATVVLVFLTCIFLDYRENISVLVALIYSVTTIAWPYAKLPFDHVIETFFILFSFYAISRYGVSERLGMLISSISSIGIAFLVRPTSILVIPPMVAGLFVMYFKRYNFQKTMNRLAKDIACILIGFLPFMLLFLWYNWYCFGSIFTTGYGVVAKRTGIDLFSITSFFTGMAGLLVSPGKGYFYYTPVAVLAFFQPKSFMKKHFPFFIFTLLLIVSYILLLSNYIWWHGDWAWGPRYIFLITPFMIIPIAELFSSHSWKKIGVIKVCTIILIITSLLIQLAAVSVDFKKYFIHLKNKEKIDFIITQHKGIPPIIEPPTKVYFSWKQSPIYFQFIFGYNLLRGLKDEGYNLSPAGSALSKETIKQINLFDIFWTRQYCDQKRYSGIAFGFLCFLLIGHCCFRLYKHLCFTVCNRTM